MLQFNWVDYTILGIITFSTLISFIRGFVREAISLASWLAAAWVSHVYGPLFAEHALTMVETAQIRLVLGYTVLFFSVLLIGTLINYIVGQFVTMTGLSPFDRILGMAFGLVRAIVLIAVLLLVGELTDATKKPWWTASQLLPQFSGISVWLKNFLPETFEKIKLENDKNIELNKTKTIPTSTSEFKSNQTDTPSSPTAVNKTPDQSATQLPNPATQSSGKQLPTTSTVNTTYY